MKSKHLLMVCSALGYSGMYLYSGAPFRSTHREGKHARCWCQGTNMNYIMHGGPARRLWSYGKASATPHGRSGLCLGPRDAVSQRFEHAAATFPSHGHDRCHAGASAHIPHTDPCLLGLGCRQWASKCGAMPCIPSTFESHLELTAEMCAVHNGDEIESGSGIS